MAVLYGSLIKNRFGFDSRCPYVSNTDVIGGGWDATPQKATVGQSFTTGGCVQPWYDFKRWVPPQRKVTKTITTKEYDDKGNVVKETVTQEIEETPGYYENVPPYTWNDWQITSDTAYVGGKAPYTATFNTT